MEISVCTQCGLEIEYQDKYAKFVCPKGHRNGTAQLKEAKVTPELRNQWQVSMRKETGAGFYTVHREQLLYLLDMIDHLEAEIESFRFERKAYKPL